MTKIKEKSKRFFIMLFFLNLAQFLSIASDLPVFPGAEGFGIYTQAGREGEVYRVTNLNPSGEGSLREGVVASGPRVIIFEVSGTIEITKELVINNPYITIAGQTAPSPGITIKGAGFRIRTHDVLIQHLRVRVGDNSIGPNPDMRRGITVNNISYNVVIDHCSLSWATDENATIWGRGSYDITYSNCIISEGLYDSIHSKGPHSCGTLIGPAELINIALIKNLYAHNAARNPLIYGNTETLLINNVVYNPRYYGAVISEDDYNPEGPQNSSIIGCTIIPGQSTKNANHTVVVLEKVSDGIRLYVEDNECPYKVEGDEWSCVRILGTDRVIRETSPPVWTSPLTMIPTANNEALNWVLSNAGARPADRDSVDLRITNDVIYGTGWIINSQNEVGGWPYLATNNRPLYLPNNFNSDDDGDEYTNLEEWLHIFSATVEEGGFTLISGTVTVDGSGQEGVVLKGLPGNPTTDASGNYIAKVTIGWSGTVTPTKSGYTFDLKSRTYSYVDSALTGQDYVGTPNTNSSFNLTISSVTGSPAAGSAGTTDPYPGNHSFSEGSSIQVTALPNTNYRFSKWTGDVGTSSIYSQNTTIIMDNNKSISAYFCTKCGDVSGDLHISPEDAQRAFDIFLGRISNPSYCEKENADVNCDGTKTQPNVTPADAHAIFNEFIGKKDLPCDCSGNSSSALAITQMRRLLDIETIENDIRVKPNGEVAVIILIDNPFSIDAFGFDLVFPSRNLEFIGVEKTNVVRDFHQVDANEIADGILRVGGYSSEPIRSQSPEILVKLLFRVIKGGMNQQSSFAIINTFDDIKDATFKLE